jgi:hypothetical protein
MDIIDHGDSEGAALALKKRADAARRQQKSRSGRLQQSVKGGSIISIQKNLDHTRSSLFQTNVVRLADVIMPEVRLAHVFGAMLDMPTAVFVSMFLPCPICPLRIAIVRLADVCITAVHLARA